MLSMKSNMTRKQFCNCPCLFHLTGNPSHFTVDTCVTETCDFFTCLNRLTRPTRPTRLTRPPRLTRITGSPAFTLLRDKCLSLQICLHQKY